MEQYKRAPRFTIASQTWQQLPFVFDIEVTGFIEFDRQWNELVNNRCDLRRG